MFKSTKSLNGKIIENVSNVYKYYWKYCQAVIILISIIIILDILIYFYLIQNHKSQEEHFINAYQDSISNILLRDLKLIFNPLADINTLTLIPNSSASNNNIGNDFILSGTILKIARGSKSIIFDMQPLISLINNILEPNFYYQLKLNNSILATNAEDIEFISVKNSNVTKNTILTIKLLPTKASKYINRSSEHFTYQIQLVFLASALLVILLIPILIYLVRKYITKLILVNQLYALNEELEFNINYINQCYLKDKQNHFPIALSPSNEISNLDIAAVARNMKTCALSYTTRYRYKFELQITSSVDFIPVKCGLNAVEQILMSLFYNILYFMRGGTHIKKITVNFSEQNIIFTYDSFSANETHMATWSKDIFEHTGNFYILDSQKIFDLIKNCGLLYQVLPKQGQNQVIIELNNTDVKDNVVKFNKKSKN